MPGRFQVAGCAIIEKGKEVLITRRSLGRWRGGFWEFVSGRMEQGEDLVQGLKREVQEEVGLEISPLYPIHVSHFYRSSERIPENEIFMVTYIALWVHGEVVLNTEEQDKYEWVNLKKIDVLLYPGLQDLFGSEIEAYYKLRT